MRCTRVVVTAEFCLFATLFLLFVPFQWVASWFVAAFVHEFTHYLALRICRIDVYSVSIGLSGAKMQTQTMPWFVEAICALSGPLGGLSLLLLGKWFPYLTLFGFIQSAYNLLPVYPLDGGRALRCCVDRFIPGHSDWVCLAVRVVVVAALLFVVVSVFNGNPLLIILVTLLLFKGERRKIPCKQSKQTVQ